MADTPLITLIKNNNSVEALALIRTGNSNPEFVNASGDTALIFACGHEMIDVALELIQTGNSKPEQVNNERDTALILACANELTEVALALIQTGNSKPEQVDNVGDTALICACKNRMMIDVALELIQTGNSKPEQVNARGDTALIYACKNGMTDAAMALIQTGESKPEHVTPRGVTALIFACGHQEMTEVILALIQTGESKPEQVDVNGNTALILACDNELTEVALALIQTGLSKPDQVDSLGDTALICACKNGMLDAAMALIQTGESNPEHVDANGDTALSFALENDMQQVVDLLLQIPVVIEAQAQQQPQPPQPAPQGVAYEIHNFFNLLNIDNIEHFLTQFNDSKPEFNANIISFNPLFSPLINFVDNTYPENKKQEKIDGLKSINSSIASYGNYDRLLPLLKQVVTFVSKQSDAFITQYIDILKYDCLNAYSSGANRSSCVKGMVERTVTVLKEVAVVFLTDEPNNEFYIQLKGLFSDFNELIQEWSNTYLDDGPKASELQGKDKEVAKSHFIAFMEQKYGASISDSIREKINAEARNFEEAGIFERLRMGGGRKGNKQTIKKKGMRKRRKTYKKKVLKRTRTTIKK